MSRCRACGKQRISDRVADVVAAPKGMSEGRDTNAGCTPGVFLFISLSGGSGHLLVKEDYPFGGDGPKSFAIGTLEQVLGVTVRVHVNFDTGTRAADWAFHKRALLFILHFFLF